MNWGMKNRISRIFNPNTGHMVSLAVDGGYFEGAAKDLRDLGAAINPLWPHADALMITRGGLRAWIPPEMNKPVILRMSGGASALKDLSDETITTSIDEAIRLNASAIACSIFVGAAHEKESIANLARLANEGEAVGMPALAVTEAAEGIERDAHYLGMASRIAVEIGARIVKTYYCADFDEVIAVCGSVPVVMASGEKLEEREALNMAADAMSKGASGVAMGPNIYQSDCPLGMIKAFRAIVHDGVSVQEAFEVYQSNKEFQSFD